MPQGVPIKEETRAEILRLIAENADTPDEPPHTRNAIARATGVSGATVGNVAQSVGYVFDWSVTEAATAARRVQADKIRENLASLFLLEAHRALTSLHEPAERIDFAPGTEHRKAKYSTRILPEPTISDQRNLMTIAGIAITKAAEVTRPQAGQGAEQGAAVLTDLARMLDNAAQALTDSGVDPTAMPE